MERPSGCHKIQGLSGERVLPLPTSSSISFSIAGKILSLSSSRQRIAQFIDSMSSEFRLIRPPRSSMHSSIFFLVSSYFLSKCFTSLSTMASPCEKVGESGIVFLVRFSEPGVRRVLLELANSVAAGVEHSLPLFFLLDAPVFVFLGLSASIYVFVLVGSVTTFFSFMQLRPSRLIKGKANLL